MDFAKVKQVSKQIDDSLEESQAILSDLRVVRQNFDLIEKSGQRRLKLGQERIGVGVITLHQGLFEEGVLSIQKELELSLGRFNEPFRNNGFGMASS